MADILRLEGRVLFLSQDPALIEAQIAGRDLSRAEAGKLRDDVSTDEITPPTTCLLYDERLGREVLIGLRTGERTPIGKDALKGVFSVVAGGRRYGKGSSREHAPLAHLHAGVRLIVAESFERIFRQNADNLGLFTSTDFGLIERIRNGAAITLDELVKDRDALAARLLRTGGLLKYGSGLKVIPRKESDARPMTLVEKILQRNVVATADTDADLAPGKGAFVRAHWRFAIEYYTPMIAHMLYQSFGKPVALHDPSTIIFFEDHLTFAHRSETHVKKGLLPFVRDLSSAHQDFARVHGLRNHGYLPSGEGSEGICHAVMAEQYALPGQLVVGTDSHTPHSGALGCLAFGVGSTDMASAMVTGLVRLTVPQSLRIELDGRIPPGVTAKDVVLHLLALPDIKAGGGVGKVFEFTGPAVAQLVHRRARHAHQHDRRARRLHRHRRARMPRPCASCASGAASRSPSSRGCAATKARATPQRSASTARASRRWSPRRATRATASRSTSSSSARSSTSPTAAPAPRASARTSTSITRCFRGPPSADCAWRRT